MHTINLYATLYMYIIHHYHNVGGLKPSQMWPVWDHHGRGLTYGGLNPYGTCLALDSSNQSKANPGSRPIYIGLENVQKP